jgi:UDPglucose 6-dehydrogenase
MRIGVAGLWHLGVMYSVGLAELGHEVIAYDDEHSTVDILSRGELIVYEPKLIELLRSNQEARRLQFTSERDALKDVELFIMAYDTPVDHEDKSDSEFVLERFRKICPYLPDRVTVMVSSQLPVGTCDLIHLIMQNNNNTGVVVVQPENLRLGRAVESFFNPGRLIVGTNNGFPNQVVLNAFQGIPAPINWVHSRSAEVIKHSLNSFLAMCVTYMGEISELCELVGADAKEVEAGLKSDDRIGYKAYLSPGLGFAGGTLARDVRTLQELQSEIRSNGTIIKSMMISNTHNNLWVSRKLSLIKDTQTLSKICFWGVSYVKNTNTLRRSEIYNLMLELVEDGISVGFLEDLDIAEKLDDRIFEIGSAREYLSDSDVLVVSKKLERTESMNVTEVIQLNPGIWILDPSRVLLESEPNLLENKRYLTVGKGLN